MLLFFFVKGNFTERSRDGEVSHPLGHSPDGQSSWRRTDLEPGASLWVSHGVQAAGTELVQKCSSQHTNQGPHGVQLPAGRGLACALAHQPRRSLVKELLLLNPSSPRTHFHAVIFLHLLISFFKFRNNPIKVSKTFSV